MRFHRAEHPAAGTWRLRLSQAGGSAVSVGVAAALEGSALKLTAAAAHQGHDLAVTATLRDGGAGVGGATVTATLRASEQADRVVALHDDGDGVYRASATALPDAEWTVTVEAHRGSDVRFAGALPDAAAVPGGGGGGESGGGSGGGDHGGGGDDGHGNDGGGPSTGGGAPDGGGATDGGPSTGGGSAGAGSGAAGAASAQGGGPAKGGTATTGASAKPSLTVTVSPARDRRAPYAWTVRGTLSGPSCAGAKVTLALPGARTVAVRTNAKCAFSATVKGPNKRGRMMITVKAGGVAKTLAVRAG
jgi:hypothetical protein